MTRHRGELILLVLAALLACATIAVACSTPVFRVALLDPRWRPERYELYVVHQGPLADRDQAALQELNDYLDENEGRVNVSLEVVDLAKNPAHEIRALVPVRGPVQMPYLVARYPAVTGIKPNLWAGPLWGAPFRALLDSPLRREIGKRLLAGDTAVWVLIESGDRDQDEAARQLLTQQIRKLETTLELPELKPGDDDKLTRDGAPPLRIAFSVVRLARTDPAEGWLLETFLGMEEDLRGRKEPIVFPIFGRGVALYALVGKGINADTIATAAGFLVGECTCEVRRQNPGVDLLMTADWETGAAPPILAHLPPEQSHETPLAVEALPVPVREDGRLVLGAVLGSTLGLAVVAGLGLFLYLRGEGGASR
jgi:hypothetical protein